MDVEFKAISIVIFIRLYVCAGVRCIFFFVKARKSRKIKYDYEKIFVKCAGFIGPHDLNPRFGTNVSR